ncbi:DUF6957 family protein [Pseudomonas syringae group genomosp. 3]|uniref:DUF6957 family protein n=1 Tax=Pseudomonas syringae group genomosp. 3 TaxID=251701 RepID=UPI0035C7DFC0
MRRYGKTIDTIWCLSKSTEKRRLAPPTFVLSLIGDEKLHLCTPRPVVKRWPEPEGEGFALTFLYARSVVLDSRGRFFQGDWVRSTFEVYFEEPCWFLTKNTLYVLLGKGGRASGDITTYGAFA